MTVKEAKERSLRCREDADKLRGLVITRGLDYGSTYLSIAMLEEAAMKWERLAWKWEKVCSQYV